VLPLADAAEAQAKIKSEAPRKEKEYEKKGEAMAAQAGQKLDRAVISPSSDAYARLSLNTRLMMHVESSLKHKSRQRNTKNEPAKI
jgi:hypothetical protein